MSRPPKNKVKTVKCDYCGKEIQRFESQIHKTNFCNNDCHANYKKQEKSFSSKNFPSFSQSPRPRSNILYFCIFFSSPKFRLHIHLKDIRMLLLKRQYSKANRLKYNEF